MIKITCDQCGGEIKSFSGKVSQLKGQGIKIADSKKRGKAKDICAECLIGAFFPEDDK